MKLDVANPELPFSKQITKNCLIYIERGPYFEASLQNQIQLFDFFREVNKDLAQQRKKVKLIVELGCLDDRLIDKYPKICREF